MASSATETFLRRVGATDLREVNGPLGTIAELLPVDRPASLGDAPNAVAHGLFAGLSFAHVTALEFALNDLADPVRVSEVPARFRPHPPAAGNRQLADLRRQPLTLGSVYGHGRVAGAVRRHLLLCLRSPWSGHRMWMGAGGQDLLRLHSVVAGVGAPLDEDFFHSLPDPNRRAFFSAGLLAEHTAIVPEARNDGSLLLSQFHAALLRYHNARATELMEASAGRASPQAAFADARRSTLAAFRRAMLDDLLPRLCDPQCLDAVLRRRAPVYCLRKDEIGTDFVPLEALALIACLVAGSRPAHVAPNVAMLTTGRFLALEEYASDAGRLPMALFNSPRVPTRLDPKYAVDWGLMLQAEVGRDSLPGVLPGYLHGLLIGAGQAVARRAGLDVLGPADVGEALKTPPRPETPLPEYLIAEAVLRGKKGRLGPLGSLILAETFVGLAGGALQTMTPQSDRALAHLLGVAA